MARPYQALRYRDFRHLWLAQLVSQTGSQMQVVAKRVTSATKGSRDLDDLRFGLPDPTSFGDGQSVLSKG